MKRRRGTRIAPPLDTAALARALAIPGGDLRHWVSYGTVAALVDENGNADPSGSQEAVVITPAGVEVDVVLEPSNYPVPCRYGIAAGDVFICGPIRVGNQVQVIFADGDVGMVPEIVKVIPSASEPIPTGGDGKPIFQNDRLLVFAKGVPIDLRAADGTSVGQVLINPDGSISFGPGADEQLVTGTTYRNAEAALNSTNPSTSPTPGLQGIWADAANACVGPLAPLAPFFLAAKLAIQEFEAKAGGFLSNTVKTKR